MTSKSFFWGWGREDDELYLIMKEAKLSVSNNIANTTEAHESGFSWKTQAEGPQLEVAT